MGHCLSYEDVKAVDTSIARVMIAQSNNHLDVIKQSIISPGACVQAAADNNDINANTQPIQQQWFCIKKDNLAQSKSESCVVTIPKNSVH